MEVDIVNREVRAGDSIVHLSGIDQSLLYLLASRAGQVVTREEILDAIWGTDFVAQSNIVDRHVRFPIDRQRTHLLTSGRSLLQLHEARRGAPKPVEDDGSLAKAPATRFLLSASGGQGLQNPTVPSNTRELGLPSASRLTSWSRPASSTSGIRIALLSGAQTRWLSAYWSK
jgi:Transcriptional regulatory protein, C terminal